VVRTSRDPTVAELLLHRSACAAMDDSILAPDGVPISKDHFLKIAPKETGMHFKGGQMCFTIYSKANWMFAGILLEELGQKMGVDGILGEEVLTPLNIQQTIIDSDRMEACSTMGTLRDCSRSS
jgi:CubicO group peptidase (beta-lactamase class C family)